MDFSIRSNRLTVLPELKRELAKAYEEQKLAALKKILLDGYTYIVLGSPVRTGLFRTNHFISVDLPSTEKLPLAMSLAWVMARGQAFVSFIKKLPKSAYITNNLDYAEALEHGSSQQAPNGVYCVAEEYLKNEINKAGG